MVPIHPDTIHGMLPLTRANIPFRACNHPSKVQSYFQKPSPNSLGHLMSPEQAAALLVCPTSTLLLVQCNRFHIDNQVLLLGNTAHAVSASVGQGYNLASQDVQVFCGLLEQYQDDWTKALPAYTTQRLADAHAVSDLSDYSTPQSK
jgi:kynurenine 3-monooxygenase